VTDKLNGWKAFFKAPASWISMAAAAISILTFYFVYAHTGALTVLLPDRVGLTNGTVRFGVVIPLVLTNTGAARRHRHIVEAATTLVFSPVGETQPRSIPLRWEYEVQFVGRLDFEQKYPDKDQRSPALKSPAPKSAAPESPAQATEVDDYVTYLSRAFPFHMAGGTSLVKVYQFQPVDHAFRATQVGTFRLLTRIRTESETFEVSGTFTCPGKIGGNYTWCLRDAAGGDR
jgi:hypothetical protein